MSDSTITKACPFCGATSLMLIEFGGEWSIRCASTYASRRVMGDGETEETLPYGCGFEYGFSESMNLLIDGWNDRPVEDDLRDKLKKVSAALWISPGEYRNKTEIEGRAIAEEVMKEAKS